MNNSYRVDHFSEDKAVIIQKWCNSMFVKGMSVKLLNINKIPIMSNIVYDHNSNTIWLISNELGSELYSQCNGNQERFLKFLTSLREEFLNSSSEPLNEFYEFTTTGNSGLKRPSQIHYLDLVETNSQYQSQVKKTKCRREKNNVNEKQEETLNSTHEKQFNELDNYCVFNLDKNTTESKVIQALSELDPTNADVDFILEARNYFQIQNTYLISMTLEGRMIDHNLHFRLSHATFCMTNRTSPMKATDFENYFITNDDESDIDSCNQTLLDSRVILEGEDNLLEAIMNGVFVEFNISLFMKYRNSRVSDIICQKIMNEKISTILKNYDRKISILEDKFDNSISDDKSQIHGLWRDGDWRKNNAFKVPDNKDFLFTEPKKTEKWINKQLCTEEEGIIHFNTFLMLWKNLELIQTSSLISNEDEMSYTERERCLVNMYVTRTILWFLYSRFLNMEENHFLTQSLSDLYYTVLESTYNGQLFRNAII